MAKDKEPFGALKVTAEQTAERVVEQAQGAMENYFGWVQKAVASSPWSNTELNKTLLNYAEENTAAFFGVVQKLSQVKSWEDAVKIQTEFMTVQLSTFSEQAKNIGEVYTKTVQAGTKTPFGISV